MGLLNSIAGMFGYSWGDPSVGGKAGSPADVDTAGAFGVWLQRIAAGMDKGKSAANYSTMMDSYTSYVYACASRNASAAAKVPLRLYVAKPTRGARMSVPTMSVGYHREKHLRGKASLRKWTMKAEPGAVEEVTEHPLLRLLDIVNDIEDHFTLFELTHICEEMTGNGYWHTPKNGLGLPEEIIPILPQYMWALTNKAGTRITGYRYKRGMVKIDYSVDDIIHFRYPNPQSRIYGLGKFAAASEAFDIFSGYNEYERALLDNQGRPDTILSTKGSVGEDERKRMAKAWKKQFGGASKAGGVFVAEGGLEPKPMAYPPKDMAPLQSRKLSREEIAAVFGVPLSKLTVEAVNLANAEAGNYSHLADTVEPMLLRNEQTLNARLTPLYGENLFLAYDDCVPENVEIALKERGENIKNGYSSINEEREQAGRDPAGWGDEPILPVNVAPISMSREITQDAPVVPEAPKAVKQTACDHEHPGEKRVNPRADADEEFRRPYRRDMEMALRDFWTEQERAILRLLRKSKAPSDVSEMVSIGLNTWNERFTQDVGPVYKALAFASGERELSKLNVTGITFDVETPELSRHFDEYGMKLAHGVNEKTANELGEAMKAGIAEGENTRELSKRIQKVFANKRLWEATTIARTETCRAQMFAAEQGMIQSGVVKAKVWSVAGAPCPWCDEMDGREIALGTAYFSELDSMNIETVGADGEPKTRTLSFDFGAINGPPLHPNCRCTLIEVMK